MNVQKVIIKKFKVIENLEADIQGKNILLVGDNGVGKSSFMQFIDIALGNTNSVPLNAEGEGEVWIDNNGNQIQFKLKFKDGKPYIQVKGDNLYIDNKKGLIANLVGADNIDPNEFVELSKDAKGRKKQVEIFKSLLAEEVVKELEKIEAQIKMNYDERTELNKDIVKAEAYIAAHPMRNFMGNIEATDVTKVYEELKKVQEHNSKISELRKENQNLVIDIEKQESEIRDLIAKVQKMKEFVAAKKLQFEKNESFLALKENAPKDTSALENQIKTASENNQKHSQLQELQSKENLLNTMKIESGELNTKITDGRKLLKDTITQMDSPVEGLSYEDDQLVFNGVPVSSDNLSESECMELGIRLKMAENGNKPLLIHRSESIGLKRWKLILDMAKKSGLQVIAEHVQRGQEKLSIEIMSESEVTV